ncbi:MAG: ABC transporter substrate-binding protein [Microthrixaceae bacterium]
MTANGHNLNAEAILALAPTVILTDYTIGPVEVQMQLRDAGIPVVVLDDRRTADTVTSQIHEVSEALGVPEAGEQLAERTAKEIPAARQRVDRLRSVNGQRSPRAVFLYLRGRSGTYDWFGKDTGADDLIAALGATDVATASGVKGYQPLNAEALAAAAPDVVLVMTDGLASVGGVDGLLGLPGVAETPAGRTRCVIDMADTEILSFGTRFAPTIDALGDALYRSGAVAEQAARR